MSSGNRPSTATPVPPQTATKTRISVDMEASTATIAAAVTSTLRAAMKTLRLHSDTPSAGGSADTTLAPISVEATLSDRLVITSSLTAGMN